MSDRKLMFPANNMQDIVDQTVGEYPKELERDIKFGYDIKKLFVKPSEKEQEDAISGLFFNSMRGVPDMQFWAFTMGAFPKTKTERSRVPGLSKKPRQEVAQAFAAQLCKDGSIVGISLSSDDSVEWTKTTVGKWWDDNNQDKLEPTFKARYLKY